MSRCHCLDTIHRFEFAEPWLVRDGHNEWRTFVGEHDDVKFCLFLPQSEVDFA